MANHKSAIKRTQQSEQRRIRNRSVKTRVKSVSKLIHANAANSSLEVNLKSLSSAQSAIDKAAKRGVIHKRAAARRKSRLARLVNKAASQ